MQNPMPDFEADEQELASAVDGRKSSCPPLDVLLAVRQGVLPSEVEEAAAKHIATCRLCANLVTDFETLPDANLNISEKQRIASTLPVAKGEPSTAAGTRALLAIAACLVLCLVGVTAWRLSHARRAQDSTSSATNSVTQHPAVADLYIPLTPLAPPNTAALITRGSGAGSDPSTADLLPAFTAYNRGDYAKAASKFESLLRAYPDNSLIHLYLGVSQLFLSEYKEAETNLHFAEETSKDSTLQSAATWYQAVALNLQHSDKTKKLLQDLCDRKDSMYSEQSCLLLTNAH